MISPRDTRMLLQKVKIIRARERNPNRCAQNIEKHKLSTLRCFLRCHSDQIPSNMFFKYKSALGPPYSIILDTNFINFSIKNKLEVVSAMMDCLLAKCTPSITDCVMAELEKLGHKYRGTYADDCLVQRVQQHRCYIVATCDRELKRRIRKIPGVPIMYISNRKYVIERLPEANAARIK
ncbi:putative rRNA-processing protein Fcf1/Utp23 [Plasmopara halstedii]